MRLIDADAAVQRLREVYCNDCDQRKRMKNGKMRFCYEIGGVPCRVCGTGDVIDWLEDVDEVEAIPVEWLRKEMIRCDDNGEMADCDLISWLIQTWQKEQEAKA